MTGEKRFEIRDGDGGVFGPAEAGVVVQWIRERRITGEMRVAAEGSGEYVKVAEHAVFGEVIRELPVIAEGEAAMPVVRASNPPVCGYAIASLFLAVAGLLVCPVLPGVMAIYYGMKSLRRLKSENAEGRVVLTGRKLAVVSMVIAGVGMVGGVGVVVGILVASFR